MKELIEKQAVIDALLAKMDTIDDKPEVVLGMAVAAGMIKDMPSALEQESCDDCISRDKAIVQLSHLLSDWDDDWNVAIRKCIETVKIVPSVTPAEKVGKWIPVIERLPKTNDDVLVYDGADMYVAWYQIKGMWQGWNSHDNSFERDTPIVAWMPLPKPYKESPIGAEGSEKECMKNI